MGTAGSLLRTTTTPLGIHDKDLHNSTQVDTHTAYINPRLHSRFPKIDKDCYYSLYKNDNGICRSLLKIQGIWLIAVP